jgi:hypothetical protein
MANDLQRIDLKVLLDGPARPKVDPLLTAFDRWRQETSAPSDWIDLADYAHMQHGPAVMMAGKREHISIDTNQPGPGILVQTRKDLAGSIEERFAEAFRRHLALSVRLTGEPEWPSELAVNGGEWIIAINDRLNFPNNDASDQALREGLIALLDNLFTDGYNLGRDADPQHRLSYRLRAEGNPGLTELAVKLA